MRRKGGVAYGGPALPRLLLIRRGRCPPPLVERNRRLGLRGPTLLLKIPGNIRAGAGVGRRPTGPQPLSADLGRQRFGAGSLPARRAPRLINAPRMIAPMAARGARSWWRPRGGPSGHRVLKHANRARVTTAESCPQGDLAGSEVLARRRDRRPRGNPALDEAERGTRHPGMPPRAVGPMLRARSRSVQASRPKHRSLPLPEPRADNRRPALTLPSRSCIPRRCRCAPRPG